MMKSESKTVKFTDELKLFGNAKVLAVSGLLAAARSPLTARTFALPNSFSSSVNFTVFDSDFIIIKIPPMSKLAAHGGICGKPDGICMICVCKPAGRIFLLMYQRDAESGPQQLCFRPKGNSPSLRHLTPGHLL